jgi:flagellar basal body P-ring formation protein FlgA
MKGGCVPRTMQARLAGIATLLVVAVGGSAAAAWTLDLADTVQVRASTVTVADVARGSVPEAAGAVVVAAGGRPGAAVQVSGRTILRRLVMAGQADGVRLAGAEHCHIVFAGHTVGTHALREGIRAVLEPHIPPAAPEAPPSWLELDLTGGDIHVAGDWQVAWPQPRPLVPGRNLVTVTVTSGATTHRLAVVAVLHAYGRTAMPVAAVGRGQAADPQAMHWQWTDLALAEPGLVTDPRALHDMVLARDVTPGQTINQRDLAPRPLVVRGELIDLVVRRGNVAATVRVECRQDGLLGQTVSIRNPLNNRLLVARVTGPGRVELGR